MARKLIPILYVSLALVLAPAASASGAYAGLTRTQAVDKAESGVIALGIAFQGWTPVQAAKFRRQLDATPVRATHSACKGTRAWRVTWPKSDPVFVNRRGLVMACSGH